MFRDFIFHHVLLPRIIVIILLHQMKKYIHGEKSLLTHGQLNIFAALATFSAAGENFLVVAANVLIMITKILNSPYISKLFSLYKKLKDIYWQMTFILLIYVILY